MFSMQGCPIWSSWSWVTADITMIFSLGTSGSVCVQNSRWCASPIKPQFRTTIYVIISLLQNSYLSHSSQSRVLQIITPRKVKSENIKNWSFSFVAPNLWNKGPAGVQQSSSPAVFKRLIKSEWFKTAYYWSYLWCCSKLCIYLKMS